MCLLPKRRVFLSLVVLLLVAFSLVAGMFSVFPRTSLNKVHAVSTSPADWVQLGFNREHTSYNPFETVLTTGNVSRLTQSWVSSNYAVGTPAVAAGVVYYACNASALCALSATTGQLLWSYPINGAVTATPAIANNLVYIGTPGGHLNALSITSGTVVWNYATGFPITDAPLTANGLVYIGASNGILYALNGTTGHLVWQLSFKGTFSTPSIDAGLLYVSAGGSLYALKSQTGKIVWHVTAKGGMPVIANGTIYLSDSADSKLLALNEKTGALLWSDGSPNIPSSPGDPAVANGAVYVTIPSGCELAAFSATTGAVLWQSNSSANYTCINGTPAIANGVIYTGSSDDYAPDCGCSGAYMFSATTGAQVGYLENNAPYANDYITYSPVVVSGTLYSPSIAGMYAYRLV